MASRQLDRSHFSPDTRAFIELLHKYRVRYVVAGGEAVIFHGHVRLTGDVAFFFDRDPDNANRLFHALAEFWGGDVPGLASEADLTPPGIVVQYGVPPNRIDLINEIDGVEFGRARDGRVEATMPTPVGDVTVPYLGLAELIHNKEATGRPRDLDDLAYLKGARERNAGSP